MISKPALHEETMLQSIRMKDGGDLTINDVKNSLEKACMEYGLNVIVETDIITSGKLFDKSKIECVTIKNAEHINDYFTEVIAMKTQGIYAFFDFYYTGYSKNNRRVAEGNREHSTITGSIIGAIKKATVSNDAMSAETQYYEMLIDAINSVLG